jgi:mono/diheme cytochrome c family protein
MKLSGWIMAAAVLTTELCSSLTAAGPPHQPGDTLGLPGRPLYDRYCLPCHGYAGDGRGPAAPFTWPRPRDFTSGVYAFRSTPTGEPPTRRDVFVAIRDGVRGTSMPAFDGILRDSELEDLVAVLDAFGGRRWNSVRPLDLGPPPPPDLARGAARYAALGCVACHGPAGRGDGPAAKTLSQPTYDLATTPLRRPRFTDDLAGRRAAAAMSIATGLDGTPMPGFFGAVPTADLWALADLVIALSPGAGRGEPSALDDHSIEADRARPLPSGTWPGGGGPDEDRLFGATIRLQGPTNLAPAEASLDAAQCARCHNKQLREWRTSLHRRAASPGLYAQVDHGFEGRDVESCLRCHAPLAEQQPALRPGQRWDASDDRDRTYAANPAFSPALRDEGVSCAACHVRDWYRHGPPRLAPSLLPIPSYPLRQLELYERADFCLPCHQLPPRLAVNRKPLLNTYKEWLEGPYMARGVGCQSCHMPNREHTFLGVHDPATFRQGITLGGDAHRDRDGAVTVAATLRNVGAGHYLPTTSTPAAWLRIELLDRAGRPIAGARAEARIGRDVVYDGGWRERSDTRIPPGETRHLVHAWRAGRVAEATTARISVEVHPDDYYERFYAEQLAGRLAPAQRALFEQALARARASYYLAEQRDAPIQ